MRFGMEGVFFLVLRRLLFICVLGGRFSGVFMNMSGDPEERCPGVAVSSGAGVLSCKRLRKSPLHSSYKVGKISIESLSNSDIPVNVLEEGSRHQQSQHFNVPLVDNKQRSRRRTVLAKRSLGAREKITWWLSNQQTPTKTPAPEDTATPRHLSSGAARKLLRAFH